uniref:C-type lectin domain-containing protein n=1 Tax=Cyprinodon variegatus TaxID=28743 RepID=A0A3Q2GLM5_CYPVA
DVDFSNRKSQPINSVKRWRKFMSMWKMGNLFAKFLRKTCPTGWTNFSCSCYFRSTVTGSWDEGRQDCLSRGADLVVIKDKDEQDFISRFAKEKTWIGLNDKETEGSWKWVDGTSMNLSFWIKDQPDNGGGDPKWGKEDCAHVYAQSQWNDLSCAASLQWICKKLPPWSA